VCASLIGFIALLGIILIVTVGVHSSYTFYGGSRLIMSVDTYNVHVADFVGYSYLTYQNPQHEGLVFLYYDHTFDLNNLS
jgi:hypothetical protein